MRDHSSTLILSLSASLLLLGAGCTPPSDDSDRTAVADASSDTDDSEPENIKPAEYMSDYFERRQDYACEVEWSCPSIAFNRFSNNEGNSYYPHLSVNFPTKQACKNHDPFTAASDLTAGFKLDLRAGRIGIDQKLATECLSLLNGEIRDGVSSCDAPHWMAIEPNRCSPSSVLEGKVEYGGPCRTDEACGYTDSSKSLECDRPEQSCSGTCRLEYGSAGEKTLGEACEVSLSSNECLPDLHCAPATDEQQSTSGVCIEPETRQKGELCGGYPDCEPGLRCVISQDKPGARCQEPQALGQPCEFSYSCREGKSCNGTQCVERYSADIGDPCPVDSDYGRFGRVCKPQLTCLDNICHDVPIRQQGETCSNSTDTPRGCAPGLRCDQETCKPFANHGESCASADDCVGGSSKSDCDSGTCAPAMPDPGRPSCQKQID